MIQREFNKGYTIWYCYSDENQKLGVVGLVERTLTQEEKTAFTSDVRWFFSGTDVHNHSITDVCNEIKRGTVEIDEIKQFQISMQCGSDALMYTQGKYSKDSILSCPLRQYIEKRKFFVTWYGADREIKTVLQTNVLGRLKYD